MRTLFKLLILILLVLSLAVVGYYNIYRETIYDNFRLYLEKQLSRKIRYPIVIGEVRYLPPQGLIFRDIAVLSRENADKILLRAETITVNFDILEFITDRKVKTTTVVEGGAAEKAEFELTMRTSSLQGENYRDAVSPMLVEQFFIMDGKIQREGLELTDVSGTINVSRLRFVSSKLYANHNGEGYLLSVQRDPAGKKPYLFNFRSEYLGLRGSARIDGNDLIFDDITGMFHILRLDMKGEVRNILTPEASLNLNGSGQVDLSAWPALPSPYGDPARKYPLRGALNMLFNFSSSGENLSRYIMNTSISGTRLRIGRIRLRKISTKLSVIDGRLTAPMINGVFCGGAVSAQLTMDLMEKGVPFIFKGVLNGAKLNELAEDLDGNKERISGDLNAELSLKGYIKEAETAEGTGSVTVSDGDLGPMPILTPLLGDMYLFMERTFSSMEQMKITGGFIDFDIRDRKIFTDDLTFMGDELTIVGKGNMDFDGNLDFAFRQEMLEPQAGYADDWQTRIRNAIIKAGKIIKESKLRGTLKEPKWSL